MSTTPNVPYRLEFSVEVPGTPEQVCKPTPPPRA